MKIFKKIIIALAILIAIPLVVALFMKKDYKVEKEVVINKPSSEVFAYIKLLKNQTNYSTWTTMAPKMTHEFRGTDGAPGFVHSWKSEMMGDGEQEIISITEGQRMDSQLRFKGTFASVAPAYLAVEPVSDTQTKVKWGMHGNMSYPLNFMQVFISMEDMIGTEYAKSLQNLKGILEK